MSPAKVNVLGLTQKSPLETIWRMAECRPTIFAGDQAWILGCRYRACSKLCPLSRCRFARFKPRSRNSKRLQLTFEITIKGTNDTELPQTRKDQPQKPS